MKVKSLCILLFIACVSTVSGSTVSIVGGDGITFAGGQFYMDEFSTATVNIVADFAVSKFHIGAIVAEGATSVDDNSLHPCLIGSSGQVEPTFGSGIWIIGIDGNAEPPVTAGEVLYSFKVTSGAAGTTIDLYDYEGSSPFPPPIPFYTSINDGVVTGLEDMSVNVVVPEPMTVALLGLGGLFLRRRK